MRALVIGDGTGRPPELEPDPVPGILASLPSVELVQVRLVADDAEREDDGPVRHLPVADVLALAADVWVTGSAPVLRTLGRHARARGVRVVHRARRVVGDATADSDVLLTALGLCDTVVVSSPGAAAWLRSRLGPATPPVAVIPPSLADPHRPRSTGTPPVLVGTGPLNAERRPPQVVRAFARVAAVHPAWTLRMVGGGPLRQELTRLAAAEGVGGALSFSGPSPNLPQEWAGASAAVLSARRDPFPVDGLAAMAAGVPVVAYDVPGGMRDLVRHGENGLLLTPSSLPALTTALMRLAEDATLRADLAAGALATAAAHEAEHGGAVARERWQAVLVGDPVAARQTAAAEPGAQTRAGWESATTSPREASAAALDLVARAAVRTGAPGVVVPGDDPVVVLPDSARGDLLAALGSGGAPAYLSVRVPEQAAWGEQRLALGAVGRADGSPVSLVVEPWPTEADGSASLLGHGCGVEVQLWGVDLAGALVPPSPNGLVDAVAPGFATRAKVLRGVEVPVLAELDVPRVQDHHFPVDAVVTWVDGDDPAWQADRDRRLAEVGRAALDEKVSGRARYQDHGELRYCLRSLHHFAPWLRTIHLVTAGQRPAWLDEDHGGVRLVDHTEILPPEALPTFSSRAIETCLHRIPDLAEHFVYVNDDVLLGRPVTPGAFFTPGGLPSVFLGRQPIGVPGPGRPAYLAAAANNRRLLLESFGVEISQTLAHAPHPQRRSLLTDVSELYAEQVRATTLAPFRSDGDVSLMSSLAQHYGLLTGRAVAAEADLAYIGLGGADLARQIRSALSRDQDFLCLADAHDYALPPGRVDELVDGFLETYLPLAAPWERPGRPRSGTADAG